MGKVYKQLSELGNIITGKTPSTADNSLWNGDIPFITPTDIDGFDSRYQEDTERTISVKGAKKQSKTILPPNTVCVSCIATIGKMCLTKVQSITNQQINSIVPNKENDYRYLLYMLRYNLPYMKLVAGGSGSGTPIISKGKFSKFKFAVEDDISIQRRIASILSTYDDLIEKNNRKIAILQEMAEELYKEWFVRFRFPGYKTAKFKDGIPEGWKYRTFGEIVTCERGISYSSEEIDCEDGVNLINLKNINAYGGFRLDGTKKYNGKYKNNQVVQCGDLVMGVTDMTQDRRTVGAVALIPPFDNTCVISADLIKVVSHIDNIFIYCLCKYGYYSKFFSQFANGSNVLHLKPSSLRNQKVLIPTEELINKFVKIVKPINDTINNLNRQNDTLTQQRDLLLPRLMSGKLEVKA